MTKLRDVEKMYDIRDLVPGLRLSAGGRAWGVCPLPDHQHVNYSPSFSVYFHNGRQMWKCHGSCNRWGSVVDLIGYLNIPGYDKRDYGMKRQAVEILTDGRYSINPPEVPPPAPLLASWKWQEFLPPSKEVIEYAYSRGITDELLVKHRIGSASFIEEETGNVIKRGRENLMSFPVFHGEELMGIKLRRINAKGKKYRYFTYPGSRKGLYGWNDVYLTDQPVLMVKGEIAKLVGERFGYLTCAPSSGERGHIEDVQKALALASVIVVGDNDKTGREGAQARAALFNAPVKFPPQPYDFDLWLLKDTDNAVREIDGWIEEAK